MYIHRGGQGQPRAVEPMMMNWETGIVARFPTDTIVFFFLIRSFQTDCGNHPASYPEVTEALLSGVNQPESETYHSTPCNAKFKDK